MADFLLRLQLFTIGEMSLNDMVLSDRRIKVCEIVETTGISHDIVFLILHEKLGVKQISARWVLRLLSEENKRNRVVDYKIILVRFSSQS